MLLSNSIKYPNSMYFVKTMSRPLRVLFCVGSLGAGGLERFVTRMAVYAKQSAEIDPVVLCLSRRSGIFLDPLEHAGVRVIAASPGWIRQPLQWWKLVRIIRSVKPDIVHSHVHYSVP